MMNVLWVLLIGMACVTACMTGRTEELSQAAAQGAGQAVTLCLSIIGMMGFWSGMMELMQHSGLCDKLTAWLQRPLSLLFRQASRDTETMGYIGANITANLLGLSNAATPIGLQAAERLQKIGKTEEVLTFIILNTTSMQLIPTTVAAVRSSLGAEQPFAVMLPIWGASMGSVAAALIAAKVFAWIGRKQSCMN